MALYLLDGARKALLDLIKLRGALSLEEAPALVGLAKTTVRQHLLQMESQGLIQRTYIKLNLGRPRLVFKLTETGQKIFPTQDHVLLGDLLKYLTETGQQAAIKGFFKAYWSKRKNRFEEILRLSGAKTDIKSRTNALHQLLTEEGFMPEIQHGPGGEFTVRECNCPFPEAIRATHLPCKLEFDFIRWALDSTVERTGYIPLGDNACTYKV